MQAVETDKTNYRFGPPGGMEDEVLDLPCERVDGELGEGTTMFYSVWEPTPEERQAITDGANIRLGVGWAGVFPPVSMGVTE